MKFDKLTKSVYAAALGGFTGVWLGRIVSPEFSIIVILLLLSVIIAIILIFKPFQ